MMLMVGKAKVVLLPAFTLYGTTVRFRRCNSLCTYYISCCVKCEFLTLMPLFLGGPSDFLRPLRALTVVSSHLTAGAGDRRAE